MISIAFFNNKGGVGKTSLVYHLAFMFAERGLSVVAIDLDPQANLSSMLLTDDRLEELWQSARARPVFDSGPQKSGPNSTTVAYRLEKTSR
jgi:chromosome partitioning protein